MARLPLLSLALLLLTTLTTASAIPTESTTLDPEVIPAPNHPNLESLSLPPSQLHESPIFVPPPPPPTTPFLPRAVPATLNDFNTCDTAQLTRSNILAGIDYLVALGNQACVVGQESVVFVTKGDVAITGYDGLMGGSTSAPCRDVGEAVRWIVDHCAFGPLAFGGTTTAGGNKEVAIRVRRA